MNDGRRLRLREQGTTKGPVRAQRKARNRLGSVSCSNEESTEGEDDSVGCAKKISGVNNRNRADRSKDSDSKDRGLRAGTRRSNRSSGIPSTAGEEDVIDGFMILSFMTFQELEMLMMLLISSNLSLFFRFFIDI
ncbi:uncharacterized protein TNCV_4458971 [Trichonephila clavipes]|nr:uncharacterized protein TNCV_4458971 [Trichonephila clavipes]